MDISKSELLQENAFALALAREQLGLYCNFCIKKEPDQLKKCSACREAVYCTKECQEGDWKQHRSECFALKKHARILDDGVRLVLRLSACWAKNDMGRIDVEGEVRSLQTLADHDLDMEDASVGFLAQMKAFKIKQLVDDDVLKKIYKRVAINSFAVSNQFGSLIGIALCIKLSKANHSCKPTARVAFKDRTAMLMPTTGSAPSTIFAACHSYIDELQPIRTRQKILKEKYHFDCNCDGCGDVERNQKMEAWACGGCEEGWLRNVSNSTCKMCGWRLPEDVFLSNQLVEQNAASSNSHVQCDDVALDERMNVAHKLLTMYRHHLYKYNVLRLPALRVLYGASLYTKDINGALEYGMQLLEIQEQYQSPTDMAVLYMKYGLAQVMVAGGDKERAKQMLHSIFIPYSQAFGPDSQVAFNIKVMLKSVNS